MIKINQTRFGEGKGNCFAACVCCLLEIEDVESVPNFCFAADNWWKFFTNWILENTTFEAKCFWVPDDGTWLALIPGVIKAPCIISGPNHDGVMHSVVYCEDGTIWNTNPTCKGLTKVVDIIFLIPREN